MGAAGGGGGGGGGGGYVGKPSDVAGRILAEKGLSSTPFCAFSFRSVERRGWASWTQRAVQGCEVATRRGARCNVRITAGLTYEEKLARGRAMLKAFRERGRLACLVRADANVRDAVCRD